MKKLIVLLLLISSIASAQMELAEDYSFKQDKRLHVSAGVAISTSMFYFVNSKTKDVNLAFRAAWMSASVIGMSKEWLDIVKGKEASLADFSYTILGGLTTALILRQLTIRRNKKRSKRNKILVNL